MLLMVPALKTRNSVLLKYWLPAHTHTHARAHTHIQHASDQPSLTILFITISAKLVLSSMSFLAKKETYLSDEVLYKVAQISVHLRRGIWALSIPLHSWL